MGKSTKAIVGPYRVYYQISFEDKVKEFSTWPSVVEFCFQLQDMGIDYWVKCD